MIHQKFPRKSTVFKIVKQDKYYEVINRKCFQITKGKNEAPRLEIRSKNVHGEFTVEEVMFYDEKFDIFGSTTGLLISFQTPKMCHLWLIGSCQ